ncbi:MAG: RNA methyltransferase [Caldisphaeraceae archaeon]|nr:RNA methyltransferase [Caldisphaeraceae archaeon]
MEALRLVLVSVEGSNNLGYILRLAENFDVDEVYLVFPKASGTEALRYAARASSVLYGVTVVPSLEDALRGAEFSICTSDESSTKDILRVAVGPREASELASGASGTVALVLGRESVGLTRDEIIQCNVLCTIQTSSRYRALNISNAASILLYEIYMKRYKERPREVPEKKTIDLIAAYMKALISGLFAEGEAQDIILAIKRIASKSDKGEAGRLLKALSKVCIRNGCKNKLELGELQ